jgi:bone morphogenetic protein 9/10
MGDMDINIQTQTRNEPLLVVFTSDTKIKGLHLTERHELVTREMDSISVVKSSENTVSNNSVHVHIPDNNVHNSVAGTSVSHSKILDRVKRRGRRQIVCHRRPMYVSFRDINWDTWIIAPHGYQVVIK